ncbi:MAG: peptidoglycan-binding protein [Deltaproteobacteria bacterium]
MPPVAMLTFSSAEVPAFKVQFNPTELSFQKQMKYAEIAIPGLDAPLQQFVRGEAEKLTLELFFDSTDKGTGLGATSVTAQTDKVFSLARINKETHAPPIVTVGWSSHFPGDSLLAPFAGQKRNSFDGVIESINQKFTLFSPEGIPLRATVNLTIREYRKLEDQIKKLNLQSPDRTHSHTLKGGETLSAVAGEEWNRPGEWRHIADANDLDDPRRLRVGTFLTIPVITPR